MSEEKVLLRVLQPSDIDDAEAVERSVYGSGGYTRYYFRQLHDLFPDLQTVAEVDGRLVGHVYSAIDQSGDVGWILNFAVIPHYRRQGIGERLLLSGVERLEAAGVKVVLATSEVDHQAAQRLFEKLGFRRLRVEENYYADGYDRIIFEKPVQTG